MEEQNGAIAYTEEESKGIGKKMGEHPGACKPTSR